MTSVVFNSTVDDMAKGNLAFGVDLFKVLLVTAAYSPDKAAHRRRSDITGEVIGTGYQPGGKGVAVTVATAEDRTDIALGGAEWRASTITARGAVYYRDRGGAAEADELVSYIDFGADVISSAGNFTLDASTVRIHH